MGAESNPVFRELAWRVPASPGGDYLLEEAGEVEGRLRLDPGHPGRATGELHGQRVMFERDGKLHPRVVVRAEGAQEPVAVFQYGWTGGGVVTLSDGARYCWNPSHIWSTTWCFRREGQKASYCLLEEPLRDGGASIRLCADAAGRPEMPILLLLGWFLRLTDLQRLEETITGL